MKKVSSNGIPSKLAMLKRLNPMHRMPYMNYKMQSKQNLIFKNSSMKRKSYILRRLIICKTNIFVSTIKSQQIRTLSSLLILIPKLRGRTYSKDQHSCRILIMSLIENNQKLKYLNYKIDVCRRI